MRVEESVLLHVYSISTENTETSSYGSIRKGNTQELIQVGLDGCLLISDFGPYFTLIMIFHLK